MGNTRSRPLYHHTKITWLIKVGFFFFLIPLLLSCSKDKEIVTPDPPEQEIISPPDFLELDEFYKKYIDAGGIPVISSEKVPDQALLKVKKLALFLFQKVPEARQKYIDNNGRIGIMAVDEVTTDIPEHSDLNEAFPGTDWDTRARGLGATLARPITTCAEENVLCYTGDVFFAEDIFVHEMTHGMHLLGLRFVFPDFDLELNHIFLQAMDQGLWENTWAATNKQEYLAEGVQSYFNVNQEAIPSNGIHNHVNTREELLDYDPGLYFFIVRFFPDDNNIPSCHR